MIEENRGLEKLELHGNDFGPDVAAALGAALVKNPTLRSLNLHFCNLGDSFPQCFLGNASLQVLLLGDNSLSGGADLERMTGACPSLTVLDLSGNTVSAAHMERISAALAAHTLSRAALRLQGTLLAPPPAAAAGRNALAAGDAQIALVTTFGKIRIRYVEPIHSLLPACL